MQQAGRCPWQWMPALWTRPSSLVAAEGRGGGLQAGVWYFSSWGAMDRKGATAIHPAGRKGLEKPGRRRGLAASQCPRGWCVGPEV